MDVFRVELNLVKRIVLKLLQFRDLNVMIFYFRDIINKFVLLYLCVFQVDFFVFDFKILSVVFLLYNVVDFLIVLVIIVFLSLIRIIGKYV